MVSDSPQLIIGQLSSIQSSSSINHGSVAFMKDIHTQNNYVINGFCYQD